VVVVVVEPALADGDDLRLVEECLDAVDAAGGVVGVDAGGGPDLSWRRATSRAASDEVRSVPTVTSRPTPAAAASAMTSSSTPS
jgi:hypothetical protein